MTSSPTFVGWIFSTIHAEWHNCAINQRFFSATRLSIKENEEIQNRRIPEGVRLPTLRIRSFILKLLRSPIDGADRPPTIVTTIT